MDCTLRVSHPNSQIFLTIKIKKSRYMSYTNRANKERVKGGFMSCDCRCNKKICPFGFGLALGLTCALAVILETLWVLYFGPSPWMEQMHMAALTWQQGFMHALMVFVKGTLFGFVLILLYNGMICLKGMGCKKYAGDSNCACCRSDSSDKTIEPK